MDVAATRNGSVALSHTDTAIRIATVADARERRVLPLAGMHTNHRRNARGTSLRGRLGRCRSDFDVVPILLKKCRDVRVRAEEMLN